MVKLSSCLYQGAVMHHRFRPAKHRFIYKVFSLCLDIDELPRLDRFRWLSINRFNLFSFNEKDHGSGHGNLAENIRQLLTQRGYNQATHRIRLLCYPRILGYAFNPLSVYFCYNQDDQLDVILYEVSNTFGSRHTYLLEADSKTDQIRHSCNKEMYVSPFIPMDTAYSFRISPPSDKVAVSIRQTEQSTLGARQPILQATFTGTQSELTDKTLLKVFFKYPLMTLKVILAIHWEALRLWRKKLSLQPRDTRQKHSISWQDKSGVTHYASL